MLYLLFILCGSFELLLQNLLFIAHAPGNERSVEKHHGKGDDTAELE